MKLRSINLERWCFIALGALGFVLLSPFPVLSSVATCSLLFSFLGPGQTKVKTFLCIALMGAYLIFSTVTGMNYRGLASSVSSDRYALLAQGLMQGNLSLPLIPDPNLLKLSDPYNPARPSGVRVEWDCSLFNGKYYLYWGVAPVLTFIIPFHFLTGNFPLEPMCALWFTCLSVIFGYLLTRSILEAIQKKPLTGFQHYFSALLLLFAVPYGMLLRTPRVYEVALLAGGAYLFMSLFFFIRAKPLAAGTLYGLAIASRPTLIFAAPIFWVWGRILAPYGRAYFPARFLVGFGPILVGILLYNYLRFSDALEFGFHYQLNHLRMVDWGFNLHDFEFAVPAFLFQWPKWIPNFPWVELESFGKDWLIYHHRYMNDLMIGLFWLAPFTFFLAWQRKAIADHPEGWGLFSMMGTGWILMGVNAVAGLDMRYDLEIIPLFVIAALAWVLYRFEMKAGGFERTLLLGLFLFSIQMGFFSSFTLETATFRANYPALANELNSLFSGQIPPPPVTPQYWNESRPVGGSCAMPKPGRREWNRFPAP